MNALVEVIIKIAEAIEYVLRKPITIYTTLIVVLLVGVIVVLVLVLLRVFANLAEVLVPIIKCLLAMAMITAIRTLFLGCLSYGASFDPLLAGVMILVPGTIGIVAATLQIVIVLKSR